MGAGFPPLEFTL